MKKKTKASAATVTAVLGSGWSSNVYITTKARRVLICADFIHRITGRRPRKIRIHISSKRVLGFRTAIRTEERTVLLPGETCERCIFNAMAKVLGRAGVRSGRWFWYKISAIK